MLICQNKRDLEAGKVGSVRKRNVKLRKSQEKKKKKPKGTKIRTSSGKLVTVNF